MKFQRKFSQNFNFFVVRRPCSLFEGQTLKEKLAWLDCSLLIFAFSSRNMSFLRISASV